MTLEQCKGCPFLQIVRRNGDSFPICNRLQELIWDVTYCRRAKDNV